MKSASGKRHPGTAPNSNFHQNDSISVKVSDFARGPGSPGRGPARDRRCRCGRAARGAGVRGVAPLTAEWPSARNLLGAFSEPSRQRHSQQNPDDTRGCFVIGDGTGVGKVLLLLLLLLLAFSLLLYYKYYY